ncbi:MAG: peptidoglycan-N-acetylglucosamine deacetylase [Acidimicrobiaceae bacterium]|jgi:peptidoglycan/xylan/chitin deacetylase (PgdA/CDA1 family)
MGSVRSRVRLLAALAVVIGLAATVVLVVRAHRAVAVEVDGRSVTLAQPSPTVRDALAAAHILATAGVVRAVMSGRAIATGTSPAPITVNGEPASLATRVRRDDQVEVPPGPDTIEPVDERDVGGTFPGLPAVERELWRLGRAGASRQVVGRFSGEVVSSTPVAGEVASRPETDKVVALTFDDGPDPKWTPTILAILKEQGVPATFCVTGSASRANADLARAERDLGHTLCDHTVDHPHLPRLSHDGIVAQVKGAADILTAIVGTPPSLFRPPYGELSPGVIAVAQASGMRVLTWNVDSQDYRRPTVDRIVANVMGAVRPGSVVLMHDGGGDRSRTAAALRPLIAALRAQGYSFATPTSTAAATP